MIEVVLANLLDNAWKYTAKTPQPKIEFGAREHPSSAVIGKGQDSGTAPSQPAPVFFVRDNGAGFDLKHAAKLFQPFQRLHREDEFPGIGIGLATVQRIVHRHGGVIQATAAPGQGATFSFSLSAENRTIKDNHESKDHPSGGGHASG
jgi:signal transduction histidine kinase